MICPVWIGQCVKQNTNNMKILVAVDFSDPKFHEVKAAATLAEQSNGMVRIIWSETLVQTGGRGAPMELASFAADWDLSEQDDTDSAASVRERAINFVTSQWLKTVKWTAFEENEFDAEALVRHERAMRSDLLIMSQPKLNNWEDFFTDSLAETATRTMTCPVLLVQPFDGPFKLPYLAFASRYMADVPRYFRRLQPLFDATEAQLQLIYVNQSGGQGESADGMRRLAWFTNQCGIQDAALSVVNHDDVQNGLMEHLYDHGVRALALVVRNKTSLERLLTAEDEGYASKVPAALITINADS